MDFIIRIESIGRSRGNAVYRGKIVSRIPENKGWEIDSQVKTRESVAARIVFSHTDAAAGVTESIFSTPDRSSRFFIEILPGWNLCGHFFSCRSSV